VIPKAVIYACFLIAPLFGWSQNFPQKGQYPSTAYPVCAADTFRQTSVALGSTLSFPVPNCDRRPDINPFYYLFTCYSPGTLGFVIAPNDPGDDYDWALFDINGHIPADLYNDPTMFVAGNFSTTPGATGASITGTTIAPCNPAGSNPNFTSMPMLIQGHKYLILVTHTAAAQSGYSLSFSGGSAVINDPKPPGLLSVVVSCDKKTLTVGLTKFVRCNSLASDGSDFVIPGAPVSIVNAVGLNCSPQFDFDYLELTLNNPLPPGNYSLVIKNGSDNNAIQDDCEIPTNAGEHIDFSVSPIQSTALDSITPPVCGPGVLHLVFSDPVRCSSIAADGSDFKISGSSAVTISGAAGNCNQDLTSTIDLTLDSPIHINGSYLITLVTGGDGNTILNECNLATPAGSTLPFSVKGAVSASFNYQIGYGCVYDTINLNYAPAAGVDQWLWNMDSAVTSSLLNPVFVDHVFGLKYIQHMVSNGLCTDTVTETVNLDNTLEAVFSAPDKVCPKSPVSFSNVSIGNIVSDYWDFGDGTSSTQQTPSDHLFPDTQSGKTYTVRLSVQNNLGCRDTVSAQITKLQSCYITVPNAFTPNGDGKNDYLYPLNAFLTTNLEFQVFNRYGQLVFETRDYSQKWDGTINGRLQETGTYIWMLSYTDGSGKKIFLKGSSVLIR
jgi:gliding motility-associated-like protein